MNIFGFKNKKKKVCDEVGACIHGQLIKILEEKETIFSKDDNSKELIFFHSYLSSLLWFVAYNKGIDDTEFALCIECKQYIINGISPSMWQHFLKAESLIDLNMDAGLCLNVPDLVNKASDAAAYDSDELAKWHGNALNLYRFFTNKQLKRD